MSRNNVKKYCNIGTYIEQRSPELYEMIFRKLCLGSMLKPQRGGKFLTFLFPDNDYIKKFIKCATSSKPEDTVAMLGALIIDDQIGTLEDFKYKNLTNRNGHKYEVSGKGKNILLDESNEVCVSPGSHLFLHWHPNPMKTEQRIFVYDITVKTKIEAAINKNNQSTGKSNNNQEEQDDVTGGYRYRRFRGGEGSDGSDQGDNMNLIRSATPSYVEPLPVTVTVDYRQETLNKVKSIYVNSIPKPNECNIYCKKVYLQLQILQSENVDIKKIANHLGNEEISDSFMLDKIMTPDCWIKLYKCFDYPEGDQPAELTQITFDKYMHRKNNVITKAELPGRDIEPVYQQQLLNKVTAPMQIKTILNDVYNGKDEGFRYGRDLFIVFCNICKEQWLADFKNNKSSEVFDSFILMTETLQPKLNNFHITNITEAEYICTFYGTLLKSDVLRFVPTASMHEDLTGYPQTDSILAPNIWRLFSLNHVAHKMSYVANNVMGGGQGHAIAQWMHDD